MSEENDIIEIVADDGKKIKVQHLGTFDYKDEWYMCFQPVEPVEGCGTDDVVIFHIEDEDGKRVLLPIEDDALLDEVFNEFVRLWEENEEGCDCEDDDCDECHHHDCDCGCDDCKGEKH